MRNIIKERFSFDYENDSTASYLVMNMSCNENILEYQIEMMTKNPYSGILMLDTRYKNEEIKLYYNITSKLTLSKFLQRRNLNKDEFIDILRGITKILLDSKEYFLYDKSFLIDEDYIYINTSTLEIGMIYIPLSLDTNVSEDFKSFLINLIISSAKIDEGSGSNYMQRILNYLKNDIFNISDFDRLLRDLKNDKTKMDKSKVLKANSSSALHALDTRGEAFNQNKAPVVNMVNEGIKSLKPEIKTEIEKQEITVKKRYKLKYKFIALGFQVLIAIILTLSLDMIKPANGSSFRVYGGIALVVAALDILLFKKLFKKENMEEIKVTKKKKRDLSQPDTPHKNINMSKREIYNVNEPKKIDELSGQAIRASEPEEIASFSTDDTVILDEEKIDIPCLERMDKGIMDRVSITEANFVIGRLANYVDYLLENDAVGRTHAEILCIEGQYFIKDLNSKNGTFLNGVRIDSNKEYRINKGDKLRFANIEYTFMFS